MTGTAKSDSEFSDRELAARFAAPDARRRLTAFLRWVEEIEQIPFKATEPAIIAMRFAWHREAVADLFATPIRVRRQLAYEGLAEIIALQQGPGEKELIAIIDAIEDGLEPARISSIHALVDQVDAHQGSVIRIGERLVGGQANGALRTAAARAAGLALWTRQFAFRAGRKFAIVPTDLMEAASLNLHRLATGRESDLAARAFAAVLEALENELTRLRKTTLCPPESFPMLGVARLAGATLKTARRSRDLYRTDFRRPLLARQFDLLKGSLSGRLA
ncbi:squalene/phytoene synthase family protein [Hyphobacterium sp.]|uniref:squalene/phytoene synthase family protein n=1 Tax=Hyphobacterium sp. TaxID=2004662 RepID=UPI003BAA94A8